VQQLIDELADVLHDLPHGLLLDRGQKHIIELELGAKPVIIFQCYA
jgi:hypothetical protein